MRKAQITWPTIILLIITLLFGILLATWLLLPLINVAVNISLIYFLFLYIRTQILKRKKGELYILSALASMMILLIVGNFLPLWPITTAGILSVIFAQIVHRIQQ